MPDFDLLVLLLPVVFMLHDFEEIILFRKWLYDNGTDISTRFPRLGKVITKANTITTPAFAIAVAEEFLLLATISFCAVYFHYYYFWIAAFMAFFLHLFIHLIQCLVLRRYTPGIITSVLLIPVCAMILNSTLTEIACTSAEIAALSAAGFAVMIVNLLLMHYFAGKLKI